MNDHYHVRMQFFDRDTSECHVIAESAFFLSNILFLPKINNVVYRWTDNFILNKKVYCDFAQKWRQKKLFAIKEQLMTSSRIPRKTPDNEFFQNI